MSIIENTKLIADFMRLTNLRTQRISIYKEPNLKYYRRTTYEKDGLCPWCHNGVSHGNHETCYVLDIDKLKYHTSWDCLMPVIEEIQEVGDRVEIFCNLRFRSCIIKGERNLKDFVFEEKTSEKTLIVVVYNCVIKYLEWLKKTEQQQH